MEPNEISSNAARLRLGLRLGVYAPSDVAAWADSQIRAHKDPPAWLVEIAWLWDASASTLFDALRELSAQVQATEVVSQVLADAHQLLANDPSYGPTLARQLYSLYIDFDYVPPAGLEQISWFDDAYSLAQEGVVGTVDGVYRELLAFTARFADDRAR